MKIISKVQGWHDVQQTSATEAERLQRESVAAVLKGIRSDEWEKFMRNFHSNKDQLARLLGKDEFRESKYGDTILTYMASSGLCGGGTRFDMVLDMPGVYKKLLDEVDSVTRDDGSDPVKLPKDHEEFIKGQTPE